jgi:esterase/lipase superfamily enzyme
MLAWLVLLLCVLLLTGCAAPEQPTLMTTPVLYAYAGVDPFAHLDPKQRTTTSSLFYVTNRNPTTPDGELSYSNQVSDQLHFGRILIRMGKLESSWKELYQASVMPDRPAPIPLSIAAIKERATLPIATIDHIDTKDAIPGAKKLSLPLQAFAREINQELASAVDKEIMLYVHGTKNNFEDAVVLAAELDHFSGRDFVSFAFCWPSHQNIISYFLKTDIYRAWHSTQSLRAVINFLSRYTQVEHINIICYSAGGKVVSKALLEMRQAYPGLTAEEVRERFKIGTVLFAAADVPVNIFQERLMAISEMAQNVVVTVSDGDDVLHAASWFMGGTERIGTQQTIAEEEKFLCLNQINNFEIIDLSRGKIRRGFDITGHHYWYRHPWASSDIVFLLRTDLPAEQRGLIGAGLNRVWYLPDDYPERIRRAAEKELNGLWWGEIPQTVPVDQTP